MDGLATVRKLPVQHGGYAPKTGGTVLTDAGALTQLVAGEPMRHVVYLEWKASGEPRGNHYHLKKHESVYVIKGNIEVTTINLLTNQKQVLTVKSGDLFESPPGNAHVFVAKEDTAAVELAPQAYDPKDTIPYKVL